MNGVELLRLLQRQKREAVARRTYTRRNHTIAGIVLLGLYLGVFVLGLGILICVYTH